MNKVLDRLRTEYGVTSFDEAEDPITLLRSKMNLIMHLETTLFVIRVEDTDPNLAALIANTIAKSTWKQSRTWTGCNETGIAVVG